jgi:hypothetical protein
LWSLLHSPFSPFSSLITIAVLPNNNIIIIIDEIAIIIIIVLIAIKK